MQIYLPVVVFVEVYCDVGINDGVGIGAKFFSGCRIEGPDLSNCGLNFFCLGFGDAGEFRNSAPHKQFEVITDDALGKALFVS